jgi:hypothetical protein
MHLQTGDAQQGAKKHIGEKTASSIHGAGKTEHQTRKTET